jgi:hypothetical protein
MPENDFNRQAGDSGTILPSGSAQTGRPTPVPECYAHLIVRQSDESYNLSVINPSLTPRNHLTNPENS